jgi:hypothetical protein
MIARDTGGCQVNGAAADLLGDHAGGQPVRALTAELGRELRRDPPVALAGLITRQQLVLRDCAGPVAVLAPGSGELEIHGRP